VTASARLAGGLFLLATVLAGCRGGEAARASPDGRPGESASGPDQPARPSPPSQPDSSSARAGLAKRQVEVAARGAIIMPFELERATHVFQPMQDGGIQTVAADEPGDAEQIRLIREHLRYEALPAGAASATSPAIPRWCAPSTSGSRRRPRTTARTRIIDPAALRRKAPRRARLPVLT
jgi:hypothetical protein